MKREKKPLKVTRETVRNLDSEAFLKAVIGNYEPVTSTVNTWGTWYPSEGCCGCA
jgi:hypothetical protein